MVDSDPLLGLSGMENGLESVLVDLYRPYRDTIEFYSHWTYTALTMHKDIGKQPLGNI